MHDSLPLLLANTEDMVIGGGIAIAILAITFGTLKSILNTRARERTKREVAAYVAEGTMTADDAAKLLKSDDGNKGCG